MSTSNLGGANGEPPSPSTSLYDISDDEEGDYKTIASLRTGTGVKLLHAKRKVYVHPTPSAKDNIPGFIALIQHKPIQHRRETSQASPQSPSSKALAHSSYLLAWVPERSLAQEDLSSYVKVDMSDKGSPPKQTYLVPPLPTSFDSEASAVGSYAFALPLSSIYSLLVRPPSLGWWYGSLVVNIRSGSSLPALFFHDDECESTKLQKERRTRESFDPFGEDGLFWGGDEVLRWLKCYVNVERSGADASVYLIDPSDEDKLGFGEVRKSSDAQRSPKSNDAQRSGQKKTQQAQEGPKMDPLIKAWKETRWRILEQLSKVTTFTRRTAQDLADNPKLPPQVRRLLHNPEVQTLQEEFDSARLYLAKWAMGIEEQSERERKQRIWTAHDVLEMEDSSVGEFEILGMEARRLSLSDQRRRPVNMEEWNSFFDSTTGKLQVTVREVKQRIFYGGLDAEDGVRKEAWLFLLGVYGWSSDRQERIALMRKRRSQFVELKGAWWDRTVEGEAQSEEQEEWWREQKGRIEKDVHRTDRHIPLFAGEDIPHPDPSSPFYVDGGNGTNVHLEQLKDLLLTYLEYDRSPPKSNPTPNSSNNQHHPHDLGYVQGMSDLLAPIYAVMQDDAVAFWAFDGFMNRMSRNFGRDQSGMRAQLTTLDQLVQLLDPKLYLHLQSAESTNFFFFFRMLLIWYKREFEWTDVLRLWEALWTDFLSSQFHLFIAVAILEKHRDVIMQHLKQFDEVLKYINELSGTIDLPSTLIRAERLFRRFEKTVEVVDRKDHFPEPRGGRVPVADAVAVADNNHGNQNSGVSPSSSSHPLNDIDPPSTSPSTTNSATNAPDASKAQANITTQTTTTATTSSNNRATNPSSSNRFPSTVEQPHHPKQPVVITPELRALLSTDIAVCCQP